ncbi:MAG: SH3 domain-containing protein [Alphaproteobacteria bacterium]
MFNKFMIGAAFAGAMLVPGMASAASPAVVTTDLNIRTGPAASYQRFGTIPGGTRVTVHGCLNGYNWCDVTWSGERGWVSGNYLAYRGDRYQGRSISNVGVSIGLPVLAFDPYRYHRSHYVGRSWYKDRYIDRDDRRDRRELRRERRDVRDAREEVRDSRRDLRDARRNGENVRAERRELRQDRRELRQERRELRRERRD